MWQGDGDLYALAGGALAAGARRGEKLMFVAQACNSLNQLPKVEKALERLTAINPDNPEAWFDLAGNIEKSARR